MTENERNEVIAECAALVDKEASDWSTTFFNFTQTGNEDGAEYAMTKALTLQDAAEAIRELSPDYKAKKASELLKIKAWVKDIIAGNPVNIPQIKDS